MRPTGGPAVARATTTRAAAPPTAAGATGVRTSSRAPTAIRSTAQLFCQRARARGERRDIDAVSRRERDLVEGREQLAQVTQWALRPCVLHGSQTLRCTQRLMRLRNRARQSLAQAMGRARRHRLWFAG